ncbi:MAG: type II toxin-antitoxin system VapC family toxin [Thermoguttaceae bacterium]
MQYLLDTHALLWYASGDERLPVSIRPIVQNIRNDVAISVVTFWEVAIKVQLGKLSIGRTLEELVHFTGQNGFRLMGMTPKHVMEYALLPLHHKDPFDRMLIAQAISENMSLIGCDTSFDAYNIKRIWSS